MSTRFRSTELSPIPRLLGWLGLILMCCFTNAVFAGQVTLAWDASAGATGYRVYQEQTDETSVALSATHVTSSSPVVATVTSTTATVGNLVEGKTYYFAVKAYNSTSESGFSNETGKTLSVVAPAPSASFSANTTSGIAPLTVKFTDSSTNATGWSWSFGDNTTSTAQSPSKTYSSPGTYTVSLTATGTGGSNTLTKASYITVTAPSVAAPVASFTTNPASGTGTAPLMVTFTDTSTGSIANRVWDFGDGTSSTSTTAQTTMKTYAAGSYIVKLTVSNSGGSNTMTKTISTTTAAPVVDFSATPTSGPAPLAVSFANGSSGDIQSWSWSFGDGGTSTAQNPSHAYDKEGTYTVSLTATSSTGTKVTKTLAGYVTVSPANTDTGGLVAAYNFNEISGTTVVDASGNGNDGIISGATLTSSGKFGKALSFDGLSSWVTVNDSASLDLTTGMTLEAWVYPTANMSDWRTVLIKEQASGAVYYLHANSDSNQPTTGVFIGSEQILRGGSSLIANQWVHLAATYDGTTQRLYVNGEHVASRAQAGSFQVSSGALRIGGNSIWGEFFKGYIDEVRIYNRALSATEIQADMNEPVTTSSTSSTSSNLIGDQTVGQMSDSIQQGTAEAFQKTATATGTVTSLSVYVDAGSSSRKLVAGLYNDNNGHPGSLIAQGALNRPAAGTWNKVDLSTAATVKAGTAYWIAILSSRGTLKFRDRVSGATEPSETSMATNLTTLPSTWRTGTVYADGPLSGYGAGY